MYFLAFVPIWGFAAATKTYVSQYVGAQKIGDIRFIQRKIQFLSLLCLLIAFHGSFIYPEKIIAWINPEHEFIERSAATLRYVSVSMFIFAFFNVYFQTINGIGKTQITFLIELGSVCLYAVTAYLLIKVWDVDIQYIWSVEYVYFCFMGLSSFAYLKLSNWKNKL